MASMFMNGAQSIYSRRQFVGLLGGGAASLFGCLTSGPTGPGGGSARLTVRPGTPSRTVAPGLWPLGLGSDDHEAYLYVPPGYVPGTATPLVLALHGAGITAQGPLNFLGPRAEEYGFLLLSVDSYGNTWDAIRGSYDRDVKFIDEALGEAFDRCSVDPAHLVIEGFSDGASYALGLGLANGDLFPRIVAFSPGFIPPSDTAREGKPEIFVSHGLQDPVLPIGSTSRLIVPALEDDGYSVTYVEYEGVHSVPREVAVQAVEWLLR